MAVLRSLKQKSREYVFTAFDNPESDRPAKIIFSRFPMPDEIYPTANQKQVLDSSFVKNFDNTAKSREALVDCVVNAMVENIASNRTDYRRFFGECVERIDDLSYDGREIKTVGDFFGILPGEAAHSIAAEAYLYAKETDVFTAAEKKS